MSGQSERSAEPLFNKCVFDRQLEVGKINVDVSIADVADAVMRRANGWRCDALLTIDSAGIARVYITGYLSTDRVMRNNIRDVVGSYAPHENNPRCKERLRTLIVSDINYHLGYHRKAA